MLIDAIKSVRSWIKNNESIGRNTFSLEEIRLAMPRYGDAVLNTELHRLSSAGMIVSVYRGFYVTVPTRYLRTGVVPPTYYIEALATYLGRPYYVSLLTAAMIHGAAHQKPQVDFVTTVSPRMSISSAKNPNLRWIYRPKINPRFVLVRNGEGGIVRYSSAEYTALDLVQYAQHCGGLNGIVTVLAELVDAMDITRMTPDLLLDFKGVTVQRLGYILDEVLREKELANALHEVFARNCRRFLPVKLNPESQSWTLVRNRRWAIEVNTELEIDEL